MVMNGKEGVGKGYEWNTLMGVPLPPSFLRVGWGLGKPGEGRRPGLLEGGCKHVCPGVDL